MAELLSKSTAPQYFCQTATSYVLAVPVHTFWSYNQVLKQLWLSSQTYFIACLFACHGFLACSLAMVFFTNLLAFLIPSLDEIHYTHIWFEIGRRKCATKVEQQQMDECLNSSSNGCICQIACQKISFHFISVISPRFHRYLSNVRSSTEHDFFRIEIQGEPTELQHKQHISAS